MIRLKQDAILGLVFFGGLILLLLATALLSNFSLTPRPTLDVRFSNAQNLSVGDPVFVLGTRFGNVQTVDYVPSPGANRIRVTLVLDRPLTLYKDYTIKIAASSLLGGKMITIDPGTSDQGIFDTTSELTVGSSPMSPLEALGEMFAGENNKESLQTLLSGLAALVEDTRAGKGTVGKLFTESQLYDEATAFVEDLRTIVREAREGRGTLGQLLSNEKLYKDAELFFEYARDVGRKVSEGEGVVARLINDKQMGTTCAPPSRTCAPWPKTSARGRDCSARRSTTRASAANSRTSSATSARRLKRSTTATA
jgi:phospholipid/cholesterol/gamma-HCH transport system substrate-binding protein